MSSGIHLGATSRGLIPVPGKVAQCRHWDKQPGRVWHHHQPWHGHWGWEHQPLKWGKPRESTSGHCKWEILTGRCEGKRGKGSFSTKSRSRGWSLTPHEGNQPRQGIISAAGLVEGLPVPLKYLPTQKILGFSCSVMVEFRKDHRGFNTPHATPRNTS